MYRAETGLDMPNYAVDERIWMLPYDFVYESENRVALRNVSGYNQVYFERGMGCRKFTFSNGIRRIESPWFGGCHCDRDYDGSTVGIEDITGEVNFSRQTMTYHDSLFDYTSKLGSEWFYYAIQLNDSLWDYTEAKHNPPCERCMPMRPLGFRLGGGNEYQFTDMQAPDEFTYTQYIPEDQVICGLSLFIQEYDEFETSLYPSDYVQWRFITCEK